MFILAEIEESRESNGIMRGEKKGVEIKSDNLEKQEGYTLYNAVECWQRKKEKGKRLREMERRRVQSEALIRVLGRIHHNWSYTEGTFNSGRSKFRAVWDDGNPKSIEKTRDADIQPWKYPCHIQEVQGAAWSSRHIALSQHP